MSSHPIEGLMTTAMQSIKEMIDVNTIVGDAVQAPDGTVIIPISKVSFGFAAGGGDYSSQVTKDEQVDSKFPFAGGSGAGVSVSPVAFMVCGQNQIKLLHVSENSAIEKVLDLVPGLVEKIIEIINPRNSNQKEDSYKKKQESHKRKDEYSEDE